MRLTLLGAKNVEGFDIQQHTDKIKFSEAKEPIDGEGSSSDDSDSDSDKDEEGEEMKEDGTKSQPDVDEDLDIGMLEEQSQDIDPDAIIEEQEGADDDDYDESKDIAQIMKEEEINLVPEDQDISELDKLTGLPSRKDTLLFGVPMLAPYSTI